MSVQQIAGRAHQYKVSGSGSKPYIINIDNPCYPNCTCVDWKIKRNRQVSNGQPDPEFYECKHIEMVYRSTDEDRRVVEARRQMQGRTGTGVGTKQKVRPAPVPTVREEQRKEAEELEAEFNRIRSIESLKKMRADLLKSKKVDE